MRNEDLKIEGSDNEPIGRLLGSLERVEAPNDFDFRVKARIAKGRPADAAWLPASVRYAVPLVLLVLVGGYFALNAIYSPNSADVPVVAESGSQNIAPPTIESSNEVTLPSNETIAGSTEVKPPETSNKEENTQPERRMISSEPKTERPGGGSFDVSAGVPRNVFPRGVDPNAKAPSVNKSIDRQAQISAKDVLSNNGIQAAFAGSGWKVESVTANSIAERSGVRAGDVIEALNDQTFTEKTAFGIKFAAKRLRVRRDGASMTIAIKP